MSDADAQNASSDSTQNGLRSFDFDYYESLPESTQISDAETKAKHLFPDGSNAKEFENFFDSVGAKCIVGIDPSTGHFVTCLYNIPSFLSVVQTTWTANCDFDPVSMKLHNVTVTRYLTGP